MQIESEHQLTVLAQAYFRKQGREVFEQMKQDGDVPADLDDSPAAQEEYAEELFRMWHQDITWNCEQND
jgi:hypothetical protein